MKMEFDDFEDEYACAIAAKEVRLRGEAIFIYPHETEPVRLVGKAVSCDGYPECKKHGVTAVGEPTCPYRSDVMSAPIEQLFAILRSGDGKFEL
ncbi:MAG TPA: hypothetical protein ENH11_00770 [Candidatus Acetothermia bacterium]|nr:hypothetical protein [Candidatus Acetothermia bacterium]